MVVIGESVEVWCVRKEKKNIRHTFQKIFGQKEDKWEEVEQNKKQIKIGEMFCFFFCQIEFGKKE